MSSFRSNTASATKSGAPLAAALRCRTALARSLAAARSAARPCVICKSLIVPQTRAGAEPGLGSRLCRRVRRQLADRARRPREQVLRATRRKLPGARVSPSSARQEIVHIDEAGRASPDLTAVKTVNSKPSFVLVHAGEACSASAPDYTRHPPVPLRGRLDSHSWTSCSIHRTARPAHFQRAWKESLGDQGIDGGPRQPGRGDHFLQFQQSHRHVSPPRAPCGARGRKSNDPGSSDSARRAERGSAVSSADERADVSTADQQDAARAERLRRLADLDRRAA